ncbi:MAG: aspartate/glutamate racemase family protein [Candidatus Thorarchaeota archaeon]
MKRIALIGVTGIDWFTSENKRQFIQRITPAGYEILNMHARYGTHSVESHADEAYNAPYILEQVVVANSQSVDAIVIDCACDPILDAAREVSEVPVVGVRNCALHVALMLGRRFSIVTVQGQSLVKCMEEGVRKEGLHPFCASVRVLDIPVLKIAQEPQRVRRELVRVVREARDRDGADVVVLGCTGLSHEVDVESVAQETGVPVIDPLIVAVKMAALLVDTGLRHSRVAYPSPPKKPISEAPDLKGVFDGVLRQ